VNSRRIIINVLIIFLVILYCFIGKVQGVNNLNVNNSPLVTNYLLQNSEQKITLGIYKYYTDKNGGKYIVDIPGYTTVSEFLRHVFLSEVEVENYRFNQNKDTEYIKTGDIVKINNTKYTAIVLGDLDKDGKCTYKDILAIQNRYNGRLPNVDLMSGTGIEGVSCDLNHDGKFDHYDVGLCAKYYVPPKPKDGVENESKVYLNLGFNGVGSQFQASNNIVENARRIHDYMREKLYAYSCAHNVYNNYSNSCVCNGTSNFGLGLNKSNVNQYYNGIKCIDCSAYVSWGLFESGIEIDRQTSYFFYYGNYSNYPQYKWEKITNWDDLQPGDVLVRETHVEFYEGNGYTLSAGSTEGIRSEHTEKNLQKIAGSFDFAIRVSK
jgi:hypothetical protein